MLTFLRINSAFQIFALGVLLLLFKLPFLTGALPILLPEMEWLIIGEKMGEGSNLYTEIWTNVAPLSAAVYWLVDTLVGRDKFSYELVAYLFIFLQAVYLAVVANQRELFSERNYLVGAIYILLASMSFDLGKLSPSLMATTFLIVALNSLAKQIGNREGIRDDVFEVGLFVGIAALFYLPMLAYLPWLLIGTVLFTGASFRQILLMVLGFVLPFFVVSIYFYFFSDFGTFKFSVLQDSLRLTQFSFNKIWEVVYTITLPLVIGLAGYFFLITNNRYNGGQGRMHQITLLGVFFGLAAYFISPLKTPMQLYGILPFLAILITGFFLHFKPPFIAEAIFLLFLTVILYVQFQGVTPLLGNGFKHLTEYRVSDAEPPTFIKGKKMLIIGERIDEYQYGKQVTAYLNWNLSRRDLAEPNDYESVVNIFDNFKQSPPEVIIDKENVIPTIFERIPELAKDYQPSGVKGVYLHR